MDRDASQRLENEEWYHGVRAMDDIKSELKRRGDFLVRAQMEKVDNKTLAHIYLAFRTENHVHNIPIEPRGQGNERRYCIRHERTPNGPRGPIFKSIGQLIEHYQLNPLRGYYLGSGVKRPRWLLKHKSVLYTVGKDELGAGNFCTVYRGKCTLDNGKEIDAAVKACSDGSVSDIDAMLREAKLMSNYSHPNVVYLIGVACDHPPIIIALEFCSGGSLDSHLAKRSPIHELELLVYCMESARGMRYLHTQRCIHRDLAARNCLISSTGVIKIADFGLSTLLGDKIDYQKDTIRKNFPLRWAAPELFNIKKEDRDKPLAYSKYSDVWAWGILCFEIYNKGVAPFAEDMKNEPDDRASVKKIATKIRNLDIPPLPLPSPEFLRKKLKKVFQKKPDARPKFNEIVKELVEYLCDHEAEAPDVKEMAVNKINGVNRPKFLMGTREELLAKDEIIVIESDLKAHVERDLPKRPSERRRTRRKSHNPSESRRHIRTAIDRSKGSKEKDNEVEKSTKASVKVKEKRSKALDKAKDGDQPKDAEGAADNP